MSEFIFRDRDFKLGEDGEIYRRANLNGEAIWVCITAWKSPMEEMLLRWIRELAER